jgi:hypothetical protein
MFFKISLLTIILFIISLSFGFAQQSSVFDPYYAPHTFGGKIDTITLYICSPFQVESRLEQFDAVEIFQKAASAWNTILSSLQIPRSIKVVKLPDDHNSQDSLWSTNTALNLIGFNNNTLFMPLNNFSLGGRTRVVRRDSILTGKQKFYIKTVQHIGINLQATSLGYIKKAAYNRSTNEFNIYLIVCHEMGHFLGLSHNVPSESIMRPGYGWTFSQFLNYDGTTDIPLQDIDKKLLKSIYAQFFITDRHKNDTCIPWSNLPTAQDTIRLSR